MYNLQVNVGPVPLAPVVETFPATTAQVFQLKLSSSCNLGDIQLSPAARVARFAEKSLLKVFEVPLPPFDFYTWPSPAEPDSAATMVRPDSVLDISQYVSRPLGGNATLTWDVPAGDRIVLRAAMTPTGTQNGPAPAEATGLEVEKMNRVAAQGALRCVSRGPGEADA